VYPLERDGPPAAAGAALRRLNPIVHLSPLARYGSLPCLCSLRPHWGGGWDLASDASTHQVSCVPTGNFAGHLVLPLPPPSPEARTRGIRHEGAQLFDAGRTR
jgi:hypothetical protein